MTPSSRPSASARRPARGVRRSCDRKATSSRRLSSSARARCWALASRSRVAASSSASATISPGWPEVGISVTGRGGSPCRDTEPRSRSALVRRRDPVATRRPSTNDSRTPMTVAHASATETAVESCAEMNISWTLSTTDAVTATRGMRAATTMDQVSDRIWTRRSATAPSSAVPTHTPTVTRTMVSMSPTRGHLRWPAGRHLRESIRRYARPRRSARIRPASVSVSSSHTRVGPGAPGGYRRPRGRGGDEDGGAPGSPPVPPARFRRARGRRRRLGPGLCRRCAATDLVPLRADVLRGQHGRGDGAGGLRGAALRTADHRVRVVAVPTAVLLDDRRPGPAHRSRPARPCGSSPSPPASPSWCCWP